MTKQSKPFPLASRLQCALTVRVENSKLEPTGMCMLAKKRLPMSTSGARLWVLHHEKRQFTKGLGSLCQQIHLHLQKSTNQKHCKSTHEEASWFWSKPWILALSLTQGWTGKRRGSRHLMWPSKKSLACTHVSNSDGDSWWFSFVLNIHIYI